MLDEARRPMITVPRDMLWAFREGQIARAKVVGECPHAGAPARLAWFKGWANPGTDAAVSAPSPHRTRRGGFGATTCLALLAPALLVVACDNKKSEAKSVPAAFTMSTAMDLVRSIGAWGAAAPGAVALADGADVFADNYYVVFDGSGSMAEDACSGGADGGRIVPARRAAIEFSRTIPASANLGLFVFDARGVGERVALGRGPANRAAFEQAVGRIRAGDGTPLGESLSTALSALRAQSWLQRGYGTYHVVVTTDGEANDKDGTAMPRAIEAIGKTPIVLETIGFCIRGGHLLNQPGKTIYRDARDPESLRRGLAAVLAEGAAGTGDDAVPGK